MNRWVWYNPSPTGRNVGDCAVRAIAKALDIDWETTPEAVMDQLIPQEE